MEKEEKIALVNSFTYSNLNYCALAWHCLCKSSRKVEMLHKRCLHFISSDYVNDNERLLAKNETVTLETKTLEVLPTEISKTVNNLNLSYMKDISITKICAKLLVMAINV